MKERDDGFVWTVALAVLCLLGMGIYAESRKSSYDRHWRDGLGVDLRPARTDQSISEDWRRNMSQTGVNDRRIPLMERQQYAERHGLTVPRR